MVKYATVLQREQNCLQVLLIQTCLVNEKEELWQQEVAH